MKTPTLKQEWPNLVLWAFLLSPILIRTFANPYAKIDLLALYTIAISVLWLAAIRFASVNQFRLHVLLLPFYLLATIDLFLTLNFNSRLTAAYLFIGLTNYKEASDLLAAYWKPIAFVLLVFVAFYGVGLAGLYRRRLPTSRLMFALSLFALLLGYGAYFYKTVRLNSLGPGAVLDLAAKDQSTPVGYLSQIGLTAHLHGQTMKYIKQRQESEVKITGLSDDSNIETVVFVIGESSRPHNWSLYGYHRPTTPNLDKRLGLYKFNRMCTTAPYTSLAVPSMLSLSPISDWDRIASTKSLVGIYRAAGYMTHWLSVQEVDSFGGIIPHIAAEAHSRQYFERSYDAALLPVHEQILHTPNAKRAIFIHIKGSHFDYARRYPDSFRQFQPATDSAKDSIIAHYDNTVLYTDWLLHTLMSQLEASNRPSVLVYTSDHGENLMDDHRGLLGHGIGNEYDLSVSAFIWATANVSGHQSAKLKKLQQRADQKVSISSLPHTLLGLTGVHTDGYNSAEDLLSDDFVPSTCPYLLGSGFVPSFEFGTR